MKIAIVDDKINEQERLSGIIEEWSRERSVHTETDLFSSGEEFCRVIGDKFYTLLFMDIIMDGKNGIESAKKLRESRTDTLLVFVTSSTEFMADAFPCHAFDYVIKPYDRKRIYVVLDEALRAVGKAGEYIEINSEKMTRKMIVSDILYVYSDSNYCIIHTKSGEQRVRISFTQLAKKLMSYPSFMEVGRGTAVNFDNTSHLSDTDCVMINGDCVPVSRRRIKAVEKAFLGRQFNKLLEEGE